MSLFDFFKGSRGEVSSKGQTALKSQDSVRVISLSSSGISSGALAPLSFGNNGAGLVIAYVSPNVDFERTMNDLKTAMPFAAKVIGVMTAGELSSCSASMYHSADGQWDNIVVQSFDASLFERVDVRSVSMFSADMRSGQLKLSGSKKSLTVLICLTGCRPKTRSP